MNVHYTGRQVELSDAQKKKLEARFQKVQRILGNRHEPEAHVVLSQERHLNVAEVTLNFRHHTMVVECSGTDLFQVVQEAAEKLEKQIIRSKDRWREKKRRSRPMREWGVPQENSAPAGKGNGGLALPVRTAPRRSHRPGAASSRIFRASPAAKPLTIEEAILEMEQEDRDCVVYQDAQKGRLSVLFRRRDGNLELVEG